MPGAKQDLRTEKALVGFPSVAWIDHDGVVLLKVSVEDRTVAGVRRSLARAKDYVRLRAETAEGEPEATARFLLMQIEERQVEYEEAKQRRSKLGFDDAGLLAEIDQWIVDLEISAAMRKVGQKGRYTLGERFLRQLEEGPRPSPRVSRGFWYAILEWAQREKDAASFRKGLDGFREALKVSDPGAKWVGPMLKRYEDKLRELER